MNKYDPKAIEPKWQQVWSDTKLYAAITGDRTRPKYYMLTEFPYPSGDGLHAGHAREYTLGDVLARHKRMLGYNVLYPMGYDAFGLPTENYAIKHQIRPQDATAKNIAAFRKQFDALGYSIDWDRQINTTDPDYYRWTQWLFLKFLEQGLAYQAEMAINWCPKEKTGLANEEVVDGKHERCGTPVEKKLLKQWMLGITKYADRLIDGLKTLDFPPRIADQQINWIGRSEGAEIDFEVAGENLTVYTTRPDTLAGATFLVLAPEHAAVGRIVTDDQRAEVEAYVKRAVAESEVDRQNADRAKTGVFTGAYAENPITGDQMPVWVADYVLAGYGTGAIMAVPAHDERDYAFAMAFDLPIKYVVEPVTGSGLENPEVRPSIVAVLLDESGKRVLSMNHPGRHDNWGGHLLIGGGIDQGETPEETARREIKEETGYTDLELVATAPFQVNHRYYSSEKNINRLARTTGFLFKLKSDSQTEAALTESEAANRVEPVWLELAQAGSLIQDEMHSFWLRYFTSGAQYSGAGPLINSGQFDGVAGAEAKQAVIKFLEERSIGRRATKYKLRDWIFSRQHYWGEPIPVIHCPKDGVVPVPEDQLPVTLPDVEHYEPTDTGESPLAAIESWVNVDCPKCGGPARRETDTMPNWAGSSWYYLRYMDARNDQAFAGKEALDYWGEVDLYLGGMEHTTLHLLYSRFWHEFLYDQGLVPTPEPYAARRGQGIVLAADGRKMSKSLGNVVNPNDIIATYGADTLRLYILFMAPYDETTPWSEDRLNGASRFVYKVWNLAQDLLQNSRAVGEPDGILATKVDRLTHKTIKKIHDDLHEMRFNTAVSSLMEFVNGLSEAKIKAALREPANAELAKRTLRTLILLLAPITPHLSEELWHELGEEGSVHVAAWPKYDPELIKDEVVTVVVQVNGKVRGNIAAAADATETELVAAAQADPNVVKHLEGGEIIKTIVIPRRVVNFVVKHG